VLVTLAHFLEVAEDVEQPHKIGILLQQSQAQRELLRVVAEVEAALTPHDLVLHLALP
jgi:hypothetical protein